MPYGSLYGQSGAALQFGAGMDTALATWQSGRANQKIDDFNADIEDQKAKQAVNQGQFALNKMGRRVVGTLSAQETSEAANGVVAGVGSGRDLAKGTVGIGMSDMAIIRANAALTAWGYQSQGASDRLRGDLAAQQARSAAIGEAVGATATAADELYRQG